jgi:molecular chaperone DnaK (HSP70)
MIIVWLKYRHSLAARLSIPATYNKAKIALLKSTWTDTGKTENSTIIAEKDRLSQEKIDRMIQEAEAFVEDDRKTKERINSHNGFESYLRNLKITMHVEDKEELQEMVDETLYWLEANPDAEKEDFDEKQKEIEQVANDTAASHARSKQLKMTNPGLTS